MSHIIVNGKKISSDTPCISVFDRGLTLGHGLFETMLSNKGSVPFVEYHWNRLTTSSNSLNIKLPFDLHSFKELIQDIILENQLMDEKAALRLTITDGIFARGILSDGIQPPTVILTAGRFVENTKKTMSATIVTTRRNENSVSSRIKSISYLDNILAKKEAVDKGFDEAFLLNSKSNIAEGAISNIFMVKDGVIFTPAIGDGALPGIIRHVILNELNLKGIEIKEQSITMDMLFNSDEIFITNALLGIKAISKLDHTNFPLSLPVTEKLSELFKKQFDYI